jgi:hypothetical protein
METPQNPSLAKLADAQWIGLWHDRHPTAKTAIGLGDGKPLHQPVQHQHPGNLIGMHPSLQMHRRSAAVTAESPGTDPHRIAIIVVNLERNILRHLPAPDH